MTNNTLNIATQHERYIGKSTSGESFTTNISSKTTAVKIAANTIRAVTKLALMVLNIFFHLMFIDVFIILFILVDIFSFSVFLWEE